LIGQFGQFFGWPSWIFQKISENHLKRYSNINGTTSTKFEWTNYILVGFDTNENFDWSIFLTAILDFPKISGKHLKAYYSLTTLLISSKLGWEYPRVEFYTEFWSIFSVAI
jgi:hypothetical protein